MNTSRILLLFSLAAFAQAESLQNGRRLLDISVSATSSFNLTAFGTTAGTPGGNCYLQGYPGSVADSTVAGPLDVSIISGTSLTIGFSHDSSNYFQNYNYSGSINQTSLAQNSSFGLISVTFTPTAPGQAVNVFSGLITGSNPVVEPTCLVNITITATAPPPPPASPPPPSSPPPSAACTSGLPCYCQNGYCFNNGATLTTSCAAPSGESCKPATINPALIGIQYAIGYPATVNVCQCTATAG